MAETNERRGGLTLAEYCKTLEGKAGELVELEITAEQIRHINSGDKIERVTAATSFYFKNLRIICKMAYAFLDNNERLKMIVNYEDLCHQLYVDICAGYVKFQADKNRMRHAIYDCFRLAAVGGLGVLANVV